MLFLRLLFVCLVALGVTANNYFDLEALWEVDGSCDRGMLASLKKAHSDVTQMVAPAYSDVEAGAGRMPDASRNFGEYNNWARVERTSKYLFGIEISDQSHSTYLAKVRCMLSRYFAPFPLLTASTPCLSLISPC